jgi:hypothetical protein
MVMPENAPVAATLKFHSWDPAEAPHDEAVRFLQAIFNECVKTEFSTNEQAARANACLCVLRMAFLKAGINKYLFHGVPIDYERILGE